MRISDWSSDVCSSDLSFRWNWSDLKRLPRMGIFPRPGTLLMLLEVLLLSRPAIMKLCPEPSSTVVSADRLLSAGTSELREKSSSDTVEIGRAHVLTPVTNAQLVCVLLLDKKKLQRVYT